MFSPYTNAAMTPEELYLYILMLQVAEVVLLWLNPEMSHFVTINQIDIFS